MVAVLEVNQSGFRTFLRKFCGDSMAVAGVILIALLVLLAVYAPLIANDAPFAVRCGGVWSFPAFRNLLSPASPETSVEKSFNFLMFFLPAAALLLRFRRRILFLCVAGGLIALPFLLAPARTDVTDWSVQAERIRAEKGGFVLTAPVPWGPYETAAKPYARPSAEHLLGADHAGRDVLARMVYGARVSVAVGFAATAISMCIGTVLGLFAGYRGGKTDLYIMRAVEIVICFPQFLLLLILMSIMLDRGSRQSILLVILVIGLFGWTGLCRLVRGETLKQRSMPYIAAAESLGVPTFRILTRHLLPNVSGPILVTFAFEVAGAILAESFLSFLGFGVQDPASSWGELMRQAFPDPVAYWHLTLWPGFAIFLAVCAFNFAGEGIRKAIG